jgi:lambda family phage portal protein
MSAFYSGASTSRFFLDWAASILSPDNEIRGSIRTLRARARDLECNTALIAGFCHELESNIIGPDGILLHAKVTNRSGQLQKETNFAIENAWKRWGNPENASLDTRASWTDLQHQIVRRQFIDGEILIRRHVGAANEFAFALQLIDPDLLDETFDRAPDANGDEIRMGVEINQDGKPLAYHLFRAHPSELARRGLSRERVRVPASEIIHFFRQSRPGQTRGVSELAPILTTVKMMDGYNEAELVAMRFVASKMFAILNNSELSAQAMQPSKQGEGAKTAASSGDKIMATAPGGAFELGLGQTVQALDLTHPNAAYTAFIQVMNRMVARAWGVSYYTVTGDTSQANYSSQRAALIPERDHWRLVQKRTAMHVHRPIFLWWLPQALLTGRIVTDNRVAAQLDEHEWRPRGWMWVDPANELDALEKEINLGINSRTRASSERGRDYEDVIDEIAEEQRYAADEGVDVSGEKGPQNLGERQVQRQQADNAAAVVPLVVTK